MILVTLSMQYIAFSLSFHTVDTYGTGQKKRKKENISSKFSKCKVDHNLFLSQKIQVYKENF